MQEAGVAEKLPKGKPALVALYTTHLHELPSTSQPAEPAPAADGDATRDGKNAQVAQGEEEKAEPAQVLRRARRQGDVEAAAVAATATDVSKLKVGVASGSEDVLESCVRTCQCCIVGADKYG